MKASDTNSIKNWAKEDRPREKLLQRGKGALTKAELLAILLGSGSINQSAVELAKEILKTSENNYNQLGKKNLAELMKFKGIGEAKAITIIAAMEIGQRRQLEKPLERKKIGSSVHAFEILNPILGDLSREEFWVLFLNRGNLVVGYSQISIGGIHGTVVDPKVVFKLALENNACGLILGHNHPSGSISPSNADITLTNKLFEAGKLLEISVLDHLIISDNNYYSFADDNKLY